ncbi:MAG: RNA methyltransferase [Saprospiraceae bacterium]|nr:RNA methyltransferase [Saprospiraceae bacterium]
MRKLKLSELSRVSVDEYNFLPKLPVVAVLDNIRSAMNVGSVFRTADAFAIERIIICGISATPPNREITKTAIGATESVRWEYIEDISEAVFSLKKQGYLIVGVEQTDKSVTLETTDFKNNKIAVIFGNEVDGISDKIMEDMDICVEIPQYGTKHSLNVSVCAGIVLWELTKRYYDH